jgi:methionine sulfoxide reductase heme-binding subunit
MTLWYPARAAGFVALLSATITVTLGALGSSARPTGRSPDAAHLDRRVLAQLVHRSAAVITLAMLGLHAVLLVTDKYVDLTLGGALAPFTAGYRGYALGLGTLAAYAFVIVAATGALRGRLAAGPRASRAWRGVHLSAYVAWALAMGHGVLAGTDTVQVWALALYGGCAALVAGATSSRIAAGVRHHRSPLPLSRRLAAAPAHPVGGVR